MKAVISNFSITKTHKFIKTLPVFFLILTFFSCSTTKTRKIHHNKHFNSEINTRKKIVTISKGLIGVKYKYGGKTPENGFDCSGFTEYVFKKVGMNIPRTSISQSYLGKTIKLRDTKSGDLIFFKNKNKINHVGIILENKPNRLIVIHSTTSKGVKKDNVLNNTYWEKRITFAKDIISQ